MTRPGRLVLATSAIAVAILVVAGWVARQASLVLQASDAAVDHTRLVDVALERLLSLVREAESGERGFVYTGVEDYLQPYEDALPQVQVQLDRISALTRDNPTQTQRLTELRSLIEQRLEHLARGIRLRREGQANPAAATGSGRDLMQMISARVALMQQTEAEILLSHQAATARARKLDRSAAIAITLLAVLLMVVLVLVSGRDARRLRQSEARLATIFGSIGDAVLTTDGEGRVERMNTVAERLTGWLQHEAQGRPLEDVFVTINERSRSLERTPLAGEPHAGEQAATRAHRLLRARSGAEIAIEHSAAPIGGSPSGSDGVVLVFRDATQSRQLDRAREASERRFRQIADGMPQIVYMTNERGEIEYLNRRWHEYTGKDGAAPVPFEQAIHPDDRDSLSAGWQLARERETPLETAFRLRGHDGRWRWFLTRAIPSRDPESGALSWYGTSTDIDAQIQARDALAEADRRKDEFVATLAHELRNPLAPIRSAVQIVRSAAADAPSRAWAVEVIDRQVRTMAALLDDLLDAARMTHGTLSLQKRPVSLRSVVDAAIETARPLIDARQQSLSVQLAGAEAEFEADPLRLTQVLANLLTNAAKYTDRGGRIEIRGAAEALQVWFAVRDSGIGLDEHELQSIFELFAQVPAAKERAEGGLGIGLALVRGLVELHGGTVTACSEGTGRGSEFRVTIPRGRPDVVASTEPRTLAPQGAVAARRLRVLVADDNQDGAESMARLLELHGFEVAMACDGEAALALADRFQPQAAVLDIGMPKRNGYDVARALRARDGSKRMYLIAATGWGQEADREKANQAGFDEHLVKPVDVSALIGLLENCAGPVRPMV
jgi:PAS domain S-box-containing protein